MPLVWSLTFYITSEVIDVLDADAAGVDELEPARRAARARPRGRA